MVMRGGWILLNNGCIIKRFNYGINSCTRWYASLPKLTPEEVTRILRTNEFTQELVGSNSIKYYDSNQLASNNPLEDARAEGRCRLTNGLLFGIFDGHGGNSCAQVVSKRLLHYIAVCLLPREVLNETLKQSKTPEQLREHLLECFYDKTDFVPEISKLYGESFLSFLREVSQKYGDSGGAEFQMESALETAFLSLDSDISNEALRKVKRQIDARTLSVAMSGAVAVVAHIDGPHLHVAGVGDCQAVLGVYSEEEGWSAKLLTVEHNTDNREEVERILSEHPESESRTVIKMERLLGQLAPLRALGDFRYKWSKELMKKIVVPYYGEGAVPPNYHTPPYLTAKPQVTYHRLTPKDKFLIIATDGLWDLLSPLEAVQLVGEHMSGKVTLNSLQLTSDMKLSEINEMLLKRKEGLKKKPLDENAATHLLRNALGGTEYGMDHAKVSQFLTLPSEVVRIFRDDISITVGYTDTEFLRNCSL
ncbi:pyruvate dehydrogenase [acetyl-transferring]-phosphatase 1, mitochondrial [Diachasma alloeum]|uniref:pyruvate dehydrogenase [acetyl-transferring]-phosphatase 1, mitochondrial n=1 Tax=Diachasma alloeum TaxID=454923 RepID=UPI0007382DAE|nr:pyruvate dehydrogenase [acetyl-transferring]-phosphatase 1, mitochondrial [Diachasma alloeum]